jgi:thiosulfate dehydrogenase
VKGKKILMVMTVLVVGLLAVSCSQQEAPTLAPTTEAPVEPPKVEVSGSVTDGGLLYDKWWKVAGVDEPTEDHPLWATQDTNTRGGKDTWRCKECHGWDYLGADGAYGSGSHFTGFVGVFDASRMSDGELLGWLDGSTTADHNFSAMGDEALSSMVTFLQDGLVDQREYIDYDTKSPLEADADHGQELFGNPCTACHGADGRSINFGDDEDPEFVGTVASGNPWEFIHKVLNGQPGTAMPNSIDSGWSMQDVVDVLAYAQTLPTELPPAEVSLSRGGRLYDKWWTVVGVDEPTEDNPLWARQDTNTRSGDDTWRCKECHGWDYMGAFGPYGSGSHFTGFPGVFFAQDKPLEDIVAQISGNVDPDHNFSAMGEAAMTDLATFITEGQIDMRDVVDYNSKIPVGGDGAHGEELYASTCSACHGDDGRMINFHDADDPEFIGNIAIDNPWEFVHKVRAGQPGTGMPSSIDLGWDLQYVIDVLTFAQTLPAEAP